MFLQPTCDCQTVTVNYARRHDTVLSKMKGNSYHMNTTVLTSTTKTVIKRQGVIEPSLLRWGGPSTSAGGFSFTHSAPAGAIQPKEVDIITEGINLYTFNVVFHSSIRKGITL
jgi:hypothetical protein